MRGEPPIPHDVVKEYLSHRVPREAVPPVVGLVPQVHGAVTRLHLDFGARPKPQTRVAPVSGRGESTRLPRSFPDPDVSPWRLRESTRARSCKWARGGRRRSPRSSVAARATRRLSAQCSPTLAAVGMWLSRKHSPRHCWSRKRLVDDPGKRWLEQALWRAGSLCHAVPDSWACVEQKTRPLTRSGADAVALAACQLTDDARDRMVRAKNSGSCLL